MSKQVFYFLWLLVFTLSSLTQKEILTPVGTWTNADKKAKFEIYECGAKLCGKIAWIKDPNQEDGKPKLDINNPDASLKNRPIMGMEFMKNFKQNEKDKWDNGTIYDPQSGKTYSCYIKIIDKNKIEVKGYIGLSLIGRSQIWTRV